MRALFGTDGIRGPAGSFPLDPQTVSRIGYALVSSLEAVGAGKTPSILVGCDTRESSIPTVAALAAGIRAAGGRLSFAGVVPTPAVAHLVRATGAQAGVSVSASHNPWPDNGIKVFGRTGRKLSDEIEHEIEREIDAAPVTPASGAPEPDRSLLELYLDHLLVSLPARLDGMVVALDGANGAAHELGPEAFRRAGARVIPFAVSPDGRNINDGCGALHPEVLSRLVAASGADLGLALDGDADRAMLVDGTGAILDGDDILYLLTHQMSSAERKPSAVVGTVMTNFGLEKALQRLGVALRRTPVGDRYVAEEMERTGALLGGEPSGHLIRADLSTTGDGILTGLLVAGGVARTGIPLSGRRRFERTPQVLRNLRVAERVPFEEMPGFEDTLRSCEARLGTGGRISVRYSGTEPLARVMVEGTDSLLVESIAETLVTAILSPRAV